MTPSLTKKSVSTVVLKNILIEIFQSLCLEPCSAGLVVTVTSAGL